MLDEHNYQLTGFVSSYLPPRIHVLSVQLHYSPRFDRLHLRSIVSLFVVSLQFVAAWCPTSHFCVFELFILGFRTCVSFAQAQGGALILKPLGKFLVQNLTLMSQWLRNQRSSPLGDCRNKNKLDTSVPWPTIPWVNSEKQSPRGLPKQKQTWRLRALTYTITQSILHFPSSTPVSVDTIRPVSYILAPTRAYLP